MPSLESRIADLEQAGADEGGKVIIYQPGHPPELPAGAEVVILLPDNGRGDQEATHV